MELVVDLHLHSHYSRATSKFMNIQSLYRWGKIKGINILGTGDFTHPAYFAELREKLEPAEPGLFKLKKEYADTEDNDLPSIIRDKTMRFVLTVEISNIYTKKGKGRRLHNLVIVPSFEAASEINSRLSQVGNLKSDGRPIIGIDSKDLLKITLDSGDDNLFVPAHIWTPWFAMFGSKSGFDSIEEAFDELSPHIVAVETGLSSDPFMNWRIGDLDGRAIISNSDAHSPGKLGREATVINAELSYKDIIGAIKTNDKRLVGTIEFFPEEGKYHYDGHKLCNVSMPGEESIKLNNLCPKCGRLLILGVGHRVEDLATRDFDHIPTNHKQVEYIVPLPEILADVFGVGVSSKKVQESYFNIIFSLGNEFSLLRNYPLEDFHKTGIPRLGEAIAKMRTKDIYIEPGYDGVYGVVKIFSPRERSYSGGQLELI